MSDDQTIDDAASARALRIAEVINNYVRRCTTGERLTKDQLIAEHPELMPELARELGILSRDDDELPASNGPGRSTDADTRTHYASDSVHEEQTRPTKRSGRLEVRCPNCHTPLEVAVDTALTDLTCSSCGSHFSLVDQAQATRGAPPLSRLGRFELIERVGVGGFGSVWKARDKELDRTVAIKIPRAAGMTPEDQEKFFREARAAAQLKHPNIVSVHEVGRDGDSIFIVCDFVRGVTLTEWLSGQQLTGREAAELCAKIADALHHAHEQGIIHRDLKPPNIMIDGDGQPHLMDFGLARREVGEVTVTLDGHVLGTPAYMSPEQALGKGHHADRRSDVYSLGVILFQLLTGELPFRGTARMLMHQVINDEPPSPRKLNANIPKDLETITLKCLEKEPSRRYASANSLSADLLRFLRREPIEARPVGTIHKVWRWVERSPRWSLMSAALAAALFASAGMLSAYVERSRRADELAASLQIANERGEQLKQQQRILSAANLEAERQRRSAEEAQLEAETQRRSAVEARQVADEQRRIAEQASRTAQREQAISLVAEAHSSIADGDLPRSKEALESAYTLLRAIGSETRAADLEQTLLAEASPPPLVSLSPSPALQTFGTFADGRSVLVWPQAPAREASILDVRTGAILRTLQPRSFRVARCQVFDSDRRAAICSDEGQIEIIDLDSGNQLAAWQVEHVSRPQIRSEHIEFAVSSHGKYVGWVSGGDSPWMAGVFTIAGKPVWTGETDQETLAFDEAEEACLIGSKIIDLGTGEIKLELQLQDDDQRFISAAFCRSGESIVMGSWNGLIASFGTNDGRRIAFAKPHKGLVHVLRNSPDGSRLISASQDGTVMEWSMADLKDLPRAHPRVFVAGTRSQWRADWLGNHRFVTAEANELRVWDVDARGGAQRLPCGFATQLSFSPDGSTLLVVEAGKAPQYKIRLLDAELGRSLFVADCRWNGAAADFYRCLYNRVAWWNSTGRRLRYCDQGQIVDVDVPNGKVERTFKLPEKCSLVTVQNAQHMLAAEVGNVVNVWDMETGALPMHATIVPPLFSLQFSPSGNQLAWIDATGLQVIQVPSGKQLLSQSQVPHSRAATAAAVWAGDSRVLFRHSLERRLGILDIALNAPAQLPAHQRGIFSVAADDEGRYAVTSSYDASVRLWDLAAKRSLLRVNLLDVAAVAMAPQATQIAVGENQAGIRIWNLKWAADLAARTEWARTAHRQNDTSPKKLADLAKWYAYRGAWEWANQLVEQHNIEQQDSEVQRLRWQSALFDGQDDMARQHLKELHDAQLVNSDLAAQFWYRRLNAPNEALISIHDSARTVALSPPVAPHPHAATAVDNSGLWNGVPRVPWDKTGDHVGKYVVVTGRVVRVGAIKKYWFLNFQPTPGHFVVVVEAGDFDKFPSGAPEIYRDQGVEVRGTISLHKNVPEIKVNAPDQIRITAPAASLR